MCLRTDLNCTHCGGTGEVMHFRCPSSMTDAEGRGAVRGFGAASYGIPPEVGGWAEQCARGVALIDVAAFEVARIREDSKDT